MSGGCGDDESLSKSAGKTSSPLALPVAEPNLPVFENKLSKEPPDKGGIGSQVPIDKSLVTEEDPDEDLDELAKAKAWLLRRGLEEVVRQCTSAGSSTDLIRIYHGMLACR